FLTAPNVLACSNCGAPKLAHRLCSGCGTYKGRTVIQLEEELA
ncbi:MAG: 50S ribosomal protein L32, partial [Desulfobulbaceae bacterium]|nr:50S ribosomal protein L32 [Desulfobulbaceae bacterium]